MNLVDSCGWLEYFSGGKNCGFFAPAVEDSGRLIVPTICVLEVFKSVLRQRDRNAAIKAVGAMYTGKLVDLRADIAIYAADIGVELNMPLADSVILATARHLDAIVWTQDADFKGLPGVKYIEKK